MLFRLVKVNCEGLRHARFFNTCQTPAAISHALHSNILHFDMTPGQEQPWSNNPKSFINDQPQTLVKYVFVCDTEISTI